MPSTPGANLASTDPSCPNLLVKKGYKLFLYNKNKPEQFGVNPRVFNDMDEYIYYIRAEKAKSGVDCPVLYLQQESNMQGQDVYRIRSGPFDLDNGVPTTIGYSDGTPNKPLVTPGQTMAPIVATTFPNTTGSMPTTFPSNLQSNSTGIMTSEDALKVMKTGTFFNNAGITGSNGFGPLSFNDVNLPLPNTQAPPLQNPTQLAIPVPPVQQQLLPPLQNQPQIQGQPPRIALPPPPGPAVPMPQPLVNGQQIVPTGPEIQSSIPLQPLVAPRPLSNPLPQPTPQRPAKYVDSSRDHPPFNQNTYAGFDPYDQYQGVYTDLDQIHDSTLNQNPTLGLSDNPMDPNWGGIMFTRRQVNSGKYDDNVVTKPIFSGSPNIMTNPNNLVPLVVPISSPGAIQPIVAAPGQNVPFFNPMMNNGSAANPPNPPFTNPIQNGAPTNIMMGENTRTTRNSPNNA